ncbi:MAG: cytochrome P450 [Anaerolineae bacterium]
MKPERAARFPLGSRITLAELSANPYPVFQRLHAEEPVTWVEETQMWFVARREDNLAVMHDWETFTVHSDPSLLEDTFGKMMLSLDGDEHYRMRQPFAAPFLPKAVRASAAAKIEAKAQQLIDTFAADGQSDLTQSFADPLALHTVMEVLGLPVENMAQFRELYHAFNQALGNFTHDTAIRARGQWAAHAFKTFVAGHLERLRQERDDSVLSAVLHDSPHALTLDEMVSSVLVIIFGGLETTAAMFNNTLWALLRHREQYEAVRANPELLKNAIEESLRWESPVQTATRQATRDSEVGGVRIAAGEMLQCMLGAANRDPAFFAAPDTFDITRHNAAEHLSFAVGRHYCLGAALARLEGQIGLQMLLERLPTMHLNPHYESQPRGHEFRTLPTLPVMW